MKFREFIVFDLDGTLVDSLPDIAASLNEALRECGAPALAPHAIRNMVGDGSPRLVARALAASKLPEALLPDRLARFLALYEAAPVARSSLYPGVAETLARLVQDGRRLGICTNKPQQATLGVLEGLRIAGYFSAIVGGDVVPAKKPDPRHLGAALTALGARPDQAVMVGDNENDAAVAEAAGVPSVLVRYGYARVSLAEIPADLQIDAFADLPAALAELDARPGQA